MARHIICAALQQLVSIIGPYSGGTTGGLDRVCTAARTVRVTTVDGAGGVDRACATLGRVIQSFLINVLQFSLCATNLIVGGLAAVGPGAEA